MNFQLRLKLNENLSHTRNVAIHPTPRKDCFRSMSFHSISFMLSLSFRTVFPSHLIFSILIAFVSHILFIFQTVLDCEKDTNKIYS